MMNAKTSLLPSVQALRAGYQHIDLTHELHPDIPVWPGHPRMCHDLCESPQTGGGGWNHALAMSEHTGTHIDAPLHFFAEASAVTDIPVEQLMMRLACLHMPGRDPLSPVRAAEIEDWEDQNGRLQERDAVMFYFGWDQFFLQDAERFLRSWPGIADEAAALLVARGVGLVGCDCLSIDPSTSSTYPAHRILLGNGVLIGENFNNLGLLPPVSTLVGLPLPIRGGTGAPVRAVALVPK